MKFRLTILTGLLALGIAQAETVCGVHDGDTLTTCDGVKVRLASIDAPELRQPFGRESRDYLRELVQGRDVELGCQGRDRYRRAVCDVTVLVPVSGGVRRIDVLWEMVGRGWAFDYPQYSQGQYAAAETLARKAHRGVWQQPGGGQRPWAYRHR